MSPLEPERAAEARRAVVASCECNASMNYNLDDVPFQSHFQTFSFLLYYLLPLHRHDVMVQTIQPHIQTHKTKSSCCTKVKVSTLESYLRCGISYSNFRVGV